MLPIPQNTLIIFFRFLSEVGHTSAGHLSPRPFRLVYGHYALRDIVADDDFISEPVDVVLETFFGVQPLLDAGKDKLIQIRDNFPVKVYYHGLHIAVIDIFLREPVGLQHIIQFALIGSSKH